MTIATLPHRVRRAMLARPVRLGHACVCGAQVERSTMIPILLHHAGRAMLASTQLHGQQLAWTARSEMLILTATLRHRACLVQQAGTRQLRKYPVPSAGVIRLTPMLTRLHRVQTVRLATSHLQVQPYALHAVQVKCTCTRRASTRRSAKHVRWASTKILRLALRALTVTLAR